MLKKEREEKVRQKKACVNRKRLPRRELVTYIFKLFSEMAGFEPTNGGVKVRSLTTWRHLKRIIFFIGQEGIRTPGTVVRSHVL